MAVRAETRWLSCSGFRERWNLQPRIPQWQRLHSFATLNIAIAEELQEERAVLDGEIVCLDDSGRSQFDELLFRRGEPRFYAFDLLWKDGKDLRYDPLNERKHQLRYLVPSAACLLYCDHIEQHGERLFEFACEKGLEGIVAKPRNSPYQFSESSTYWRKIKNRDYTQQFGRDDLFPHDSKPVEGSWATCALVCAEVEM